MPAISDSDRLRIRGKRMLELATRVHCEKNNDFARLLTQLAFEVFAHTRELEDGCDQTTVQVSRLARQSVEHIGHDRSRRVIRYDEPESKL